MKLNLYVVYDTVRESILYPIAAPNESVAIRENCHALFALNRDFEVEFQLFHVGHFDTRDLNSDGIPKLFTFDNQSSSLVPWDSYEGFHEIVDAMSAREVKQLQLQANGKTRL